MAELHRTLVEEVFYPSHDHMVTYPAWKLQRWQGASWTFIAQPD